MFNMYLLICFCFSMCGVVRATAAPAPFEVQVDDFKTYSFTNTVPNEFKADVDSELSISSDTFKADGHSLLWKWSDKSAVLTYKHPEAFRNLSGEDPDPIVYEWITCTTLSSFSLWVFNEKAIDQKLRFEIGSDNSTDCSFWMNLNFEGWQELKAMYGRDIEGFPNQDSADTMRIIAPRGMKEGMLRFDLFSPRREMDVRFVRPTPYLPWMKPHKTAESYWSQNREQFIPPRADPAVVDSALLDRMTAKYLDQYNKIAS